MTFEFFLRGLLDSGGHCYDLTILQIIWASRKLLSHDVEAAHSSDPLLTCPCRRMTPTSGVFFLKSYHPKPWLDLTTHSSRLLGSRRRRYHQTTQPGQPTSVVTCTYMMLKKYYICEVRIPRLISDACILMLAISKSTF
jgi:hypothetical protein